ncbi:MAG TPA: class I SAM-dependent methyltransferase [Tepidiformaceae bacterium]|nr:class I SAM-dependent methyltransferase [Tepidiformaceae bacterium]
MRKDIHETNRLAWNAATQAHNSHKGDQARYLREGGSTLFPEEVELLGGLAGKSLVHLQCNAGQDTLSLAKLGATVTGVDISDEAIAFATRLSEQSGIPATFVRSDVYDWFAAASARGEQFDRVFSSYGAIMWLSDMAAWGQGIAAVLKPGGTFVLVEFHPFSLVFNEKLERDWPYFPAGPIIESSGVGDYVAYSKEGLVPWGYEEGVTGFTNPHPSGEFAWGIGDVVTALIDAGLRLEVLREYEYANGCARFDGSVLREGRRYYLPDGVPNLPQMFAVRARKG